MVAYDYSLLLTSRFHRQLEEVLEWYDRQNEKLSLRLLDKLEQTYGSLRSNPFSVSTR